ncbi:MAG TPA: hypothetical protein VFK69_08795 [Candidatus Eisenbacteria bacterium]|nr:hypothetical protein [Candidatus Eisenbacteria bacterium]
MLAAVSCAPPDRARLSEVYYDAPGDDTGFEFVELFNPLAVTVSLAGVRIEAGDGAGPARWTPRWTGTAADSIPARGRFVVGGSLVTPAPQAVVELQLQNGPDAVRLVWPDGAIEVLGWGALAYPEYFCGAPAIDVPSGQSLARVPDDADRGSNALDFRPASPSPGRANAARRDIAVVRGRTTLAPEQPDPGGTAVASAVVLDAGLDSLAAGAAAVELDEGDTLLARAALPALVPGETLTVAIPLAFARPGRHHVMVRGALPGDENPADDADTLLARAGPGPLQPTEIQFHPAHGEGEWVEVANRSADSLDLATFTLADRSERRGAPAGGAGRLAPDSLAVLAQDRAALLAAFPALDPWRVWQVSPWASLNNSDDSTGISDVVTVRELDGVLDARVPYSSAGVPSGVPIEWRDGAWQPARDPLGTPLRPPPVSPPIAGRFEVTPRRVRAGAPLHCAWALPWERPRITLELYDLAGRRVARGGAPGLARGATDWLPADIAPGAYAAVLRARGPSGAEIVEARAVRVEPAR